MEFLKITTRRVIVKSQQNQKSEVLYQKLGKVWYAFSHVKNNIVFSALPAGVDPMTAKFDLYEVIEKQTEEVQAPVKSPATAA